MPIHALIQHPGDHPNYTQMVMERLRELAKELQKKIDQKQPHKALVADVFEQLKDLEEELWGYLVRLSRSLVDALTDGQEFVHPHVRYAPEQGTSTYEWGALY